MTTEAITPLRQRMIEDMNARKLGAHSQRSHIYSCKLFAAFLKRSPENASCEDIRRFQLHLADTGDRPEPVQPRGGHEIHVLPLHHGEDATRRALQRRLDRVQRGCAAGSNGSRDAREEHHVPQRQHGEAQFLTHQLARRI